MSDATSLILALALFGVGALVGLLLGAGDWRTRRRERELRQALEEERGRFESYQGQVARHMDETAHLFRDLTHQHATLYRHLAQGARELAPRTDRIGGHAFDRPLIEFASEDEAPSLSDSQSERPAPRSEPPSPQA